MAIELVDSHTHLDFEAFDIDRAAVIERALSAGVTRILTIGAGHGIESTRRALALAKGHNFIWASAGVHPLDAGNAVDMQEVATIAHNKRVVAIGETGLDFFRDGAPAEVQEECFRAQIELALELKKPLIIHSRAAGEECIKILKDYSIQDIGGVFHCYGEDAAFAKRLKEINFLVSFPGTLTFKNAENVRQVAREVPLEQIMVETDAPYMAPDPHRGKRCESSFVLETAKMLAKIKGLELEEVARITTQNAVRLFNLQFT